MTKRTHINDERLLIPLADACIMLGGVCRQFVMKRVSEGDIPCVRFGRKVFFTPEDLKRFVDKSRITYDPIKIDMGI
jgi:hypothetical protein